MDDVKLLLQRQRRADNYSRVVDSKRTFEDMVLDYLPMEYAEELLPCLFMPSARHT